MSTAYIVDYLRSPFTPAYRGALAGTRPDDLVAGVIKALVDRSGVDPAEIEDVNLGCAFPEGEQGLNIARCAALIAGLPQSVGGSTVNRWCGSSMQAIQMAAGAIAMGAGDVFVAGGVENMSRVPMMGFNPMPNPGWSDVQRLAFLNMGLTAENLADRYSLSREEQDAYSLESQKKALAARADGRLAAEIAPVGDVTADGCPRETDAAKLAGLKTAPPAELEHLASWQGFTELLLTRQGTWRKRIDKGIGFPSDARDCAARKAELARLIEALSRISVGC